jgi:Tfp pilus assembly protein PilF
VPIVILFLVIVAAAVHGQSPGPEYATVEKAYESLRSKDYDGAILRFKEAIGIAPNRAPLHTELAYTLLKIGETEEARDEFGEAMRLDPGDEHVALEYAFLCYETKQQVIARRTFDRVRARGNATAAQAFENIDRPLREGIARWTQAVQMSPDNFGAHEELARLAEQRDELTIAAEHYEKAWHLKPDRRSVLLDLGRVWKALGRDADGMAALLAASRGGEPRVAEEARELLPKRYPYVYEFQKALEIDPSNVELRRELAYLHLEMGDRPVAEKEFQAIVSQAPDDLASDAQLGFLHLSHGDSEGAMALFERVLAGKDDELSDRVRVALRMPQVLRRRPEEPRAAVSTEAKELAGKSLEKGYLKDALRYLQTAHENDPLDFNVMLKLGWTYNILKDDRDAVRWFDLARHSPDQKTAAEASKAYHNLKPGLNRFRTTVWAFPMFSTRWHDLFAYAQVKTELRLPRWLVHPYISARFVGDTKGSVFVANLGPEYLSERAVILAIGLATNPWHGMTGWFEAGESLRYAPTYTEPGRMVPDYRGGLSFAKGFGGLLARGGHGLFAETNDDGLYVSRFAKDTLLYSQNRTGYTFRSAEGVGDFHFQIFWNWNITVDELGQYWANYVETGPGMKFRFEGMPQPMAFSVSALRGAYLVNQGNPRRPNFNDVRIGIWYALSR